MAYHGHTFLTPAPLCLTATVVTGWILNDFEQIFVDLLVSANEFKCFFGFGVFGGFRISIFCWVAVPVFLFSAPNRTMIRTMRGKSTLAILGGDLSDLDLLCCGGFFRSLSRSMFV